MCAGNLNSSLRLTTHGCHRRGRFLRQSAAGKQTGDAGRPRRRLGGQRPNRADRDGADWLWRGLIYLLVGAFAVAAAFNLGKQPHGIIDAVQAVTNGGLRLVLAAVSGVGLACLAGYFAITGLWQFTRARGAKHWLSAAGMLGDALIYAAVMIAVLGILIGWQGDGEQQTQAWTAWVLTQPFGRVLVGIAGALILACGIGVVIWVMTSDIDEDVDLPSDKKRVITPIGR